MANVTKILGNEIALTTAANTVDNATLVRLINITSDTTATITVQNADSANIASFTLGYIGSDESVVYLKKESTDKLIASANSVAKAVKAAFS